MISETPNTFSGVGGAPLEAEPQHPDTVSLKQLRAAYTRVVGELRDERSRRKVSEAATATMKKERDDARNEKRIIEETLGTALQGVWNGKRGEKQGGNGLD